MATDAAILNRTRGMTKAMKTRGSAVAHEPARGLDRAGSGLALAGLATCAAGVALGLWLALAPQVELGVHLDTTGTPATIASVWPGGPAWGHGLRAGMTVVENDVTAGALTAADASGVEVRATHERAYADLYDVARWAWIAAALLITGVALAWRVRAYRGALLVAAVG